jgi:hypothetical protein
MCSTAMMLTTFEIRDRFSIYRPNKTKRAAFSQKKKKRKKRLAIKLPLFVSTASGVLRKRVIWPNVNKPKINTYTFRDISVLGKK